jgi:hypothetical protein
MASDRTVQFGRVLERERSNRKAWLLIIPAVAALLGIVGFGLASLGQADSVKRELTRARAEADDLKKQLDKRTEALAEARTDQSLLESTGQAAALLYGVAPDAYESGLVLAHPGSHAAIVHLFGLRAPEGQEYAVAARAPDGSLVDLGPVKPDERGDGFLLTKKVPEGANAIELVLKPSGQAGLEGATPRVSARYPTRPEDRGVLQAPAVQARRGRR